jgi:hypothetical protein
MTNRPSYPVGPFEALGVSTDLRLEETLVDVVGLYLNPPESIAVFTFDLGSDGEVVKGTPGGSPTNDRDGVTTHESPKDKSASEVLPFVRHVDLQVTRTVELHAVVDHLSSRSIAELAGWLAHPRQARWHLHFMQSSSTLSTKRLLKAMVDRRLRSGALTTVADLVDAVNQWTELRDKEHKAFLWAAQPCSTV